MKARLLPTFLVWVRWKRLDAVSEAFTQWREWFVMIAGMLLITKTLPAAFGTVQATKQALAHRAGLSVLHAS